MTDAPDDPDREGEDAESDDELAGDVLELTIDETHAGDRIDATIAALSPALSRAQAQRLIEAGLVRIGDAVIAKANHRVHAGDAVEVIVPRPEPIELVPEDIPLSVLYEDADLIVIDKPAGLVVHPAPGHPRGTLVNALLHHCTDLGGIGGELRPGIVHRLDKDTSGAIVVAKTERAHAGLTAAFAAKSLAARGGTPSSLHDFASAKSPAIRRAYLAIASPAPPDARGTVRTFHGRHPTDRKKFSSKVTWGKTAVTHFEVIEALRDAALVRFVLETGRTHQIRVHAADHGWPLLGDPLYGRAHKPTAEVGKALGRQALHAAVLDLTHPVTGAAIHCEAPLPPDFAAALAALRTDP